MNLFINDVFVRIARPGEILSEDRFNHVVDCSAERITRANIIHHSWIKYPEESDIDELLAILDKVVTRNIYSITITPNNFVGLKNYIKSKYSIIKAAGGIVKKGNKILMIYRMKKWDLPKGKINKFEKTRDAALREVEEECNIKVKAIEKVCKTWHTYTMKKKSILKKTTWYAMKVTNDKNMSPQLEENIEEIRYMTPKELFHALDDSYRSIRFVIHEYNNQPVK